MAKTNVKRVPSLAVSQDPLRKTFHGVRTKKLSGEAILRRSVLATMLFEDQFYEDGQSIHDRIKTYAHKVSPAILADLAVEARSTFNLRHVSLLLARELARHPGVVSRNLISQTIANTIQRADELAEFVAIYWLEKRQPLSAQVKKGLALAFHKFNEYQLQKYNGGGAVKLRDVLFLSHAKPRNRAEADLWKRLVDGKLATPDTWETELSAGKDKKATFERLLSEDKLGALALLRNLRNMVESGVDRKLVVNALKTADYSRVLPFRFIAAANHAPGFESQLDDAMQATLASLPKLPGKTVIAVDVSGSMVGTKVSKKSELDRRDAAAALAAMAAGICEDFEVFAFTDSVQKLPQRKGLALVQAIKAVPTGGTNIGNAVRYANGLGYDRLIVLTDEESHDAVSAPLKGKHAYMVNVGSYTHSVGYGEWTRLAGFSESLLKWIAETEKFNQTED